MARRLPIQGDGILAVAAVVAVAALAIANTAWRRARTSAMAQRLRIAD